VLQRSTGWELSLCRDSYIPSPVSVFLYPHSLSFTYYEKVAREAQVSHHQKQKSNEERLLMRSASKSDLVTILCPGIPPDIIIVTTELGQAYSG
jgi:hypothetical protein